MDANTQIIALLEEIAFNTSGKVVEREEYLRRVYASGIKSATQLHGGVQAQPATHERKVPLDESSQRVYPKLTYKPSRT